MDKDFLLHKSKTFCMLPWVHLNVNPSGNALPCCLSKETFNDGSLQESFNNDIMKKIRSDMLAEKYNKNCSTCHDHETVHLARSFRKNSISRFGKHIDIVDKTSIDGSLNEFKLRYFDVRLNNICNFKCRTCNSEYSSQWEQENYKHLGHPLKIKNDNQNVLKEIKDQINNLEIVYFAGGEPLITEEHYTILEEIIRQGKTDIELIYNTNASTLKFKDKDLLTLWNNFKKVRVTCSVDHYGEKAEYIRHGTDWATVENNIKLLSAMNNVRISIGTVLSVFNYLTVTELYAYLKEKNLFGNENTYMLYKMVEPNYLSARILPVTLKQIGRQKVFNYRYVKELYSAVAFTEKYNQWEIYKTMFQNETRRLDNIRSENFTQVFPELGILLDE